MRDKSKNGKKRSANTASNSNKNKKDKKNLKPLSRLEAQNLISSDEDPQFDYGSDDSDDDIEHGYDCPDSDCYSEHSEESDTILTFNSWDMDSIPETLEKISKKSSKLETFKLKFEDTTQYKEFFTKLHEDTKITRSLKLKNLEIHFEEPNEALNELQFNLLLIKLNLSKLESFELGSGLWEDVNGSTVNKFLTSCAKTLKNFKITGNFQGDDEWFKILTFELPEMDELENFSFGSNYDFLSVYEEFEPEPQPGTSSRTASKPAPEIVSLTETQLLRTRISFPNELLNLKTLQLGNLISIENMSQITKSKFPSLKSFRVSSKWNESIDLVETATYSIPIWITIQELQLPDCIGDEKFIQKLYRMFPNLLKAWINLPTVTCLRKFFFTMHRSKLRELYLQTQYDFKYVLETAFITKGFDVAEELEKDAAKRVRGTSSSSSSSSSSSFVNALTDLEKLKNPINCDQIYNDFIHHHNLSLPLTKESMNKIPYGISCLNKLQILELHHVPRLLKIPTSNTILFTSPNASFDLKRRFGFEKYPLAPKLFTEEFSKCKNLKRLKFLGENFTVNKDVWFKFCTKHRFNNFADWSKYRDDDDDDFGCGGGSRIKDKLEPSKISRAKEFLPKNDPWAPNNVNNNDPSGSSISNNNNNNNGSTTGIPLINPYTTNLSSSSTSSVHVKIEIKDEPTN